MGLALINTPVYEEVLEDINNIVHNSVETSAEANVIIAMLEDMASEGSTEEFLYSEMGHLIRQSEQDA